MHNSQDVMLRTQYYISSHDEYNNESIEDKYPSGLSDTALFFYKKRSKDDFARSLHARDGHVNGCSLFRYCL